MINVVALVPSITITSGGLGLAALRLSENVAMAGAKVTLMAEFSDNEPEHERKKNNNIDFFDLSSSGARGLTKIFRQFYLIKNFFSSNDVNVLHLHGVWSPIFFIAFIVAKMMKVGIVVSPHGCFEPWALSYKSVKKKIALCTYQGIINRYADKFVATSPQEIFAISKLGIAAPVEIIPNGVDASGCHERPHFGNNRTLLFLSRIHPKKGLINLIHAWSKARKDGWQVVIAGPDEESHLAEVRNLIAELRLEADFEFPGVVYGDAKTKLLTEATIFVLPTYSENFGIVVAEALSFGVPVITTTGTPWEELENFCCGWWVAPEIDALAGAIRNALDCTPDELKAMGDRGRALVERCYSWEAIGRNAVKMYNIKSCHRI